MGSRPGSSDSRCLDSTGFQAENSNTVETQSADGHNGTLQPTPATATPDRTAFPVSVLDSNAIFQAENSVVDTVETQQSAGGEARDSQQDDRAMPPGGPEATPQGTPTASLQAAVAWLRMSLEAGPQPIEALLRWWTQRGYDPAVLYEARDRIGAVECQDPRATYWKLPN